MTAERRNPGKAGRMLQTAAAVLVFAGAAALGVPSAMASGGPDPTPNYSKLLDFIRIADRQDPLIEFATGETAVDQALNRENMAYLNQNQELIDRIRFRLESEDLKWQLAAASKRLMIVPENRAEYATLFENYCQDVITYVLDRTHLPNPYQAIATLKGPPSLDAAAETEGIVAYLVHNVADEYVEEYVFSDSSGEGKKIKIKLRNRVFTGVVGSYTSNLVIGENQDYAFEREPYTLWQNSADNPMNVFIAPIEETLHIALRDATEGAIRTLLTQKEPQHLSEVEAIVEECMAVEEAVVGGLVSRLLPEVFDRYLPEDTARDVTDVMNARGAFAKYRYLDRGIALVTELGLDTAIDLYKTDPGGFRSLLDKPEAPDKATQPAPPAEAPREKTAA